MQTWRKGVIALTPLMVVGITVGGAWAGTAEEERIAQLERAVEVLTEQVQALLAERQEERTETVAFRERIEDDVEDAKRTDQGFGGNFDIGGYAELHANFNQGKEGDQIDIHRFVLDFGYEFEDWIRFRSELEIEHGFIKDGDGEIVLEQFYVDFLLSDAANVRAGRFLTPLGFINQRHEPASFYGVERPNVDKYIIPTTWSSDGVGLYGKLHDSVSYEAYVAGGLDGSKFDPIDGIRGGRIKERPSLNDLSVMGRVDYFPFVDFPTAKAQTLRLGLSGFHGGLDNGDQGKNPGLSGPSLTMAAADFEYSVGKLDIKGLGAYQWIEDAEELPAGVAEEMFGWYLQGGYRVFPESWKKGRFRKSDLVAFVRYEDFDTQAQTVSGVARVPGGDRQEWTTGLNFYFTPAIVFKADYQFVESDAVSEAENRWNLGLGMQF